MLSCSLVKQRNLFDVVTRQMGHVPPSGHRQWAGVLILSHVRLSVTPWTAARQAPLSVGFSRQEYQSGLPRPPPGDLPDPGIKPAPLASPALVGGFFTTSATWEAPWEVTVGTSI